MSEADTVPTEERLPWLGEEAEPVRDHRTRDAIGLAIVAALLIFGVSYWIASQSWQRARERAENQAVAPPAAVPLPKAPQVAATRRHRPAVTPSTATRAEERPIAHPKQQLAAKAPSTSEVAKAVTETKIAATKPAATRPTKEVAASTPVTGRIVRVGAFASPIEAKLGWRSMVRAYPVLAHLPAAVVDASSARSKPSYRFEIGTTSEANSAVLCQRMARINFACAVASR
jgi:cytoskeletal protein RodZ